MCSGLPWRMASSSALAVACSSAVWGVCGASAASSWASRAFLVAQHVQLPLERVHAPLEALGVEVAVLEGVEVAVDRALRALDLGGDGSAAVFECRPLVILSSRRLLDRGADEVAVAVDVGELSDDRVLQLLARDAVAVAASRAPLLAA